MRHGITIALAVLVMAVPAVADIADQTRIRMEVHDWQFNNPGNDIGEFRATVIGSPFTFQQAPVLVGSRWPTFCLEPNETMPSATQEYTGFVNSAAVRGGDGGFEGGNPLANLPGQSTIGDPLDQRTAFLFSEFAKGTLAGYDFADSEAVVGGRVGTAWALQHAIWYFEDDIGRNDLKEVGNAQHVARVQRAKQFIELADAAVANGWSGIGDVRALNLYKDNVYRQDVLVYLPGLTYVPAPGAVVLGALGLAVVGGWMRRRLGGVS